MATLEGVASSKAPLDTAVPALLSQPPDLAAFASTPISTLPSMSADASDEAGLPPTSLSPSVSSVDELDQALVRAQRRTRKRWLIGAAAAVILVGGATFGFFKDDGSRPMASVEKASAPKVPVRPKAAARGAPAPTSARAALAVPQKSEKQAQGVNSEPVADFAAAFAAAPNPKAGVHTEVIVRVSPLGSQIYDGQKLLAQTAAKVQLTPGTSKTLMVHLEGYQSRKVFVDGSSASVNVLMRPLEGTAPAPSQSAPASTQDGESWLVRSERQRAAQQAPPTRTRATETRATEPPPPAPAPQAGEADILPPL